MQAELIANGTFTLTWPDGQRHRTFRIKTQPSEAKQREQGRDPFAPGKRVISLMTGTDNELHYTGFGFVSNEGIKVWNAISSGTGKNSARVWNDGKLLEWCRGLWQLATEGEQSALFRAGFRLLAKERCVVCNRPLTNPESIRTKIGPECSRRREKAAEDTTEDFE